MACTLVGELRSKRYRLTPSADQAERAFIVRSDNKSDEGTAAIAACGVSRKDAHPTNSSLLAIEFSAEQDGDAWWKWTVTVRYSKPESDEELNPLNRDPQISYSTESVTVAAVADVDTSTGDPDGAITSSAGEPYDPPPETEIEIQIISITRNEAAAFSVDTFYDYQGAVNSNSFTFGDLTIPVALCKLRSTIGPAQSWVDPDTFVTTNYREVNYTLAINPLGWDITILDAGTYWNDSGDIKKFLDEFSEPYIGLLDGSGGKLTSGSAVFRTFNSKKRLSFVPLSLPSGP